MMTDLEEDVGKFEEYLYDIYIHEIKVLFPKFKNNI